MSTIPTKMVNIRDLNDLVASKNDFVKLITKGMDQTIVGQKHLIESLLIALLSNGHVLLEGVPGLAKHWQSRRSLNSSMQNTAVSSLRPTCCRPMCSVP